MGNFLKKLFGSKEKNTDQHTTELSEPELTIARANNEIQLRTQIAIDTWGLDTAEWSADLNTGTITFVNDEKKLMVTAPVQIVGTYNTEDNTWLWGWDHPSVSESLSVAAQKVRDFGTEYHLEALTTRKLEISMEDAWGFAALACYLSGGEGCYTGSADTTKIFMVYGTVTISNKD